MGRDTSFYQVSMTVGGSIKRAVPYYCLGGKSCRAVLEHEYGMKKDLRCSIIM